MEMNESHWLKRNGGNAVCKYKTKMLSGERREEYIERKGVREESNSISWPM